MADRARGGRPGIRTSEFWLSLLAAILGALISSGAFAQGSPWVQGAGVLLVALSALGYGATRARIKGAEAARDAAALNLEATKRQGGDA